MNKVLIYSVILASTCMAQATVAQPEAGDKEFTLSGSGQSDNSFRSNGFNVSGSYGWFQTDAFEVGIRQSIGLVDAASDDSLSFVGSTAAFADYHFDFNEFQPFVGISFGASYGTSSEVEEDFIIGPELGLKYYIQPKTFIQLQSAYLFRVDEDPDQGAFRYTVGLGINF